MSIEQLNSDSTLSKMQGKLLQAMQGVAVDGVVPSYDEYYTKELNTSRAYVYQLVKELINKGYLVRKTRGYVEVRSQANEESTQIVEPKHPATVITVVPPTQQSLEEKEIEELISIFRQRTCVENPQATSMHVKREEKEGIHELYLWLKSRGVDAYDYIKDAIPIYARKTQRGFPYFVSIVRKWGMNGKGYMPTHEDTEMFQLFKDLTEVEPSVYAQSTLRYLISNYGLIKVASQMPRTFSHKEIDKSKIYVDNLRADLQKTYPTQQ